MAFWTVFIGMICSCVTFFGEQKTVLVTGGAGFLGSHLCERLLRDGHTVICLDNLSSGSKDNIVAFLSHPQFFFLEEDVSAIKEFSMKVDEIYNLACPASPPFYQADPVHTLKTSVLGALFVLELAKKWDAKVLQASTSEVYGDPIEHPQKESYRGNVNPIGIRACYDEGKRAAEALFFDYQRMHGTKIKVARIFNTYGPRMRVDDGRVVTNFISQALKGEPITIYGDGSQTRSFCYVSDLIEGLVRLMDTADDITGPINIGNPREFTVLELAFLTIRYTGSSSSIVYCPLPGDDPCKRKPDISLARSVLKWEPFVDLEEGLVKTIQAMQPAQNGL